MTLLRAAFLASFAACVAPAQRPVVDSGARPDTAGADTARGDTAATTDTADTARDTSDPVDTDGLVGVRLDPPLDAPAFLVDNHRREPRTPDWLVGDPAVLWFFRDAGST